MSDLAQDWSHGWSRGEIVRVIAWPGGRPLTIHRGSFPVTWDDAESVCVSDEYRVVGTRTVWLVADPATTWKWS